MKSMHRRMGVSSALIAATATLAAPFTHGEPSVYPTGTTVYDPRLAYNSFIVFGAPDGNTHLIDMNGHEVHRWDRFGTPALLLDPALTGGKKGELLVQLSYTPPPPIPSTATGSFGREPVVGFGNVLGDKTIGELDWNGKTVWEWGTKAPGGAARQNHDYVRLPNGDTLLIGTVDRVIPSLSKNSVGDQVFYEVTSKGDIVWKWYVADHIPEFGVSPEGLTLLRAALAEGDKSHGFLTINALHPIGPNKWFDAGDTRFHPDNLVISSRELSLVAIIEKKTGKIVWRIGPDYATKQSPALRPLLSLKVPRPVDQTSGQHDAHIIPVGLPGAGNLLLFDNEGASGFPPSRLGIFHGSRILEINPTTKQIVWQYTGLDSDSPFWSFNSSFSSSARRLPNGNTLIGEGTTGRFFQVTPAGKIVWEYVNPYFGRQTLGEGKEVLTNWIFRAQPVPYDWVPSGTPHTENPLPPVNVAAYRVPGSP